jgi:type IV pilus assembly protein PilM
MAVSLRHLISDPRPDFAFEISEGGIAWVRPSTPAQPGFVPFQSGVLAVSPLKDNVQRPDILAGAVSQVAGGGSTRKRRRAVVILPDYCARVAVLDFDAFPSDPNEQMSLVRFRMKKAVPFDVESAAVRYFAQPAETGSNRYNVVVVVVALEILARYEAPFRAAGLHAGYVTTSSLAAMELDAQKGVSMLAKLSGRVLSVSVLNGAVLKLLRTVELSEVTDEEILAVLFPTIAFIEDEFKTRPERLLECGFDGAVSHKVRDELGVLAEPLNSRWGMPTQHNAGLLGYLESLK